MSVLVDSTKGIASSEMSIPQVLEAFSDAILMDSRAFSLDLKLFFEKYNDHRKLIQLSSRAAVENG